MSQLEHTFDINNILKKTYLSLKQLQNQKYIDLIFEMNRGLPRELRGNNIVLEQLLVTLLSFILQNTKQKDILLSISAPEDFMYEESVSFKIKDTNIPKEKILAFLETDLGANLNVLNGKIVNDDTIDLNIEIPFVIGELGFRRHYRLPSESMLGKKVLLIVQSENITRSITTMFKYFPCDVDFGYREFNEDSIELLEYDLVVIEEGLVKESFCHKIEQIQKKQNLKYVFLGDNKRSVEQSRATISTHLIKPVTQESIFELIISVFSENDSPKIKKVVERRSATLERTIPDVNINIPKILQTSSDNSSVHKMIEEKKSTYVSVLNITSGLKNCKKQGVVYADELVEFLEAFYKSDLYFRQIVNEKQTNKIKDFCIDLEKQSKIIGAESMQKFSDIVSLIFVYDKLDMLPIYPGKYHLELKKLVSEIKNYLHIK